MARKRTLGLVVSTLVCLAAAALVASLIFSIRRPDPRVTKLLAKAERAEAGQQFGRAVQAYRQALEIDPENEAARRRWSALAARLNRPVPKQVVARVLALARRGDAAALAALLDKTPAAVRARGGDQATPLHLATAEGRIEAVRLLLERGALVEANDGFGQTPLLKAAFAGHTTVVKALLDFGARVNPERPGRTTALHWAVIRWRPDLAE